MRLKSKKRIGYSVDIDQQGQCLTIYNEKDRSLLSLSVDDLLDRLLGPHPESFSRRMERRVNLTVRLRYSFQGPELKEGITGNIGAGGIFIETTSPAKIGTIINLEMILPTKEDEPVHATGEVVWVRTRPERIVYFPGMSIRFDKISPDDQDRIRELTENISKIRYGTR